MTPLDRVGIRRVVMHVQKVLMELARSGLAGKWPVRRMQLRCEEQLFDLCLRGAFYDFEVVVNEYSTLVGIQPRPFSEWVSIEQKVEIL